MPTALNTGSSGESMDSLLHIAANKPHVSETVSLDYTAGDFHYFQPYLFGQYDSQPPSPSPQTNIDYLPQNDFLISNIQIKCTPEDIAMVDDASCDPNDPGFMEAWKESAASDSALIKKCYRSQTCANSQLSKSLSILTSGKDGQLQRKQDLEDVYFFDCMNILNVVAAIAFYLSIIIYKISTPTPPP